MVTTQVELYQGNKRLVMPVTFSDKPLGRSGGRKDTLNFTYEDVLKQPLSSRPTPAELSYLYQEMQHEHDEIISERKKNLGKAYWNSSVESEKEIYYNTIGRFFPSWTAHGAGISDKKSPFEGKPIIAVVKSINLANGTVEPDYDRAVALDEKLFKQRVGGIEKWETVGEYKLEDGTTQYFAIPVAGKEFSSLGNFDTFLAAYDEFSLLSFERGEISTKSPSFNHDGKRYPFYSTFANVIGREPVKELKNTSTASSQSLEQRV